MNKIEFLTQFDNLEISQEHKINYLAYTDFKTLIPDKEYQNIYSEEKDKDIENFLHYKFLGKYDCDKIFGEMFGYEYTDTMNSFWTLFKQYIKINMFNEFELEGKKIKQEYIDNYKKQYDFELTNQQLWIVHILNIIKEKNIEFDNCIKNFAILAHTIGNFMEVPAGFNTNRYTNTLDYFDLTLLCIYKWYQTGSDFWLEILLNNNQEAIENTKDWLLSYNLETEENLTPWEIFVGLNNLEGFIDDNNKPIEFFAHHFDNFEILLTDKQKFENYNEKSKLLNPQNNYDLVYCVTNIINAIIFRGKYISNYELENINQSQQEQDENQNSSNNIVFDKLIITNNRTTDFPIKANILSLDAFIGIAGNGITVDDLYIDIDVLDEDLYNAILNEDIDFYIFKTRNSSIKEIPSYIQQSILNW